MFALRVPSLQTHPVPLKALVAFDRFSLGAGQSTSVSFGLGEGAFSLVDAMGNRTLYKVQRAGADEHRPIISGMVSHSNKSATGAETTPTASAELCF